MTSSHTAAPSLEGLVKSALHRSWWLLLLRGIIAVAFGVATFVWPGISLVSLILVYGIYAVADGILALIAAIRGGGVAPRWWLALGGIASLVAGGLAFVWPGLTALVLVYLIGFWSIMRGVARFSSASSGIAASANQAMNTPIVGRGLPRASTSIAQASERAVG